MAPGSAVKLLAISFVLAGCSETLTVYPMHNPQTGEQVHCESPMWAMSPTPDAAATLNACVAKYANRGFIPGNNSTGAPQP
jgi:hypothetical protein